VTVIGRVTKSYVNGASYEAHATAELTARRKDEKCVDTDGRNAF